MAIEGIDWKLVFAIAGTAVGIASFIPYIYQILKGQTKPHAYTWLIWSITQGIATAGLYYGGAGITAYGWILSTAVAFATFLLSLFYGTKNITRGDTLVLVGAFAAIAVWQGLHNALLAVLMATLIDFLGYLPTYRKSYAEPWSENIAAWVGYVIGPSLSFFSLAAYNLLTATYILMAVAANLALVLLLLIRRQSVPKPV